MSNLIKVSKFSIGGADVNSVNMRDVWEFVASKRDFSDWINDRLSDCVEGQDFVIFHKNMGKQGRPLTEYVVTVDCAKMICMLERNEKGKQLRQYFVDMEKVALAKPALGPTTYKEALKALLAAEEEKELLLEANTTLAIKVREKEGFNCLAGAIAKFGWPDAGSLWRTAMGTLAVKIQQELGTRTEKIPDERFGSVNAHDDRVWMTIQERYAEFTTLAEIYKILGWKLRASSRK